MVSPSLSHPKVRGKDVMAQLGWPNGVLKDSEFFEEAFTEGF